MEKKKPVKPVKPDNYKIVITSLGDKWTKEGKTIKSTLDKFDLTWEQIKGNGELTISKGKKKHTQLMSAVKIRRIFSNKIVKGMWVKNLRILLG